LVGDGRNLPGQNWKPEWDRFCVTDCGQLPVGQCEWSDPVQVGAAYQDLMIQFADEIGVSRGQSRALV
jgi:hypothetical protein